MAGRCGIRVGPLCCDNARAVIAATPALTILTFGSSDESRWNGIVGVLETPLEPEALKTNNDCYIDLKAFYYDEPSVYEALAAPLQVHDVYAQRFVYRATVWPQRAAVQHNPYILTDRKQKRKWLCDAGRVTLNIPVLDYRYGKMFGNNRHYLTDLNNWDLKQTCENWRGQPPAGAIVIDRAMTERIWAHEQSIEAQTERAEAARQAAATQARAARQGATQAAQSGGRR